MKQQQIKRATLGLAMVLASTLACASTDLSIPGTVVVNIVDGTGIVSPAGTIKYEDTEFGLLFTPDLNGLPAGLHGFHIHEKPSCAATMVNDKPVPAGAAGAHYDPEKTGKHGSPYTRLGHKGDLPALYVAHDGTATNPVLAPRLKAKELQGRSIMLHVGGDNHSDMPALGGGGARMACGVFFSS